jgi:RNA polymerase sigma-70 factor (ECF subfamily)
MDQLVDRSAVFEALRGRLFGLAYRMTGTRTDAEDIVQEAYLRWHQADVDDVRSPEAWLVTAVTRLSVDHLRKAAAEREAYTGPWLPEPLSGRPLPSPAEKAELACDLSIAFLTLLERLAPVERAAFLLHDVFDVHYAQIARILQKSEAACRQVVHRARGRVRRDPARFKASEADQRRLIETFIEASNTGDEATLLSLFAEDATLTSDGGGAMKAARKVVRGRRSIARLLLGVARKTPPGVTRAVVPVNGEPGLVTYFHDTPFSVTSFDTDGRSIRALYVILNPAKLKGIGRLDGASA